MDDPTLYCEQLLYNTQWINTLSNIAFLIACGVTFWFFKNKNLHTTVYYYFLLLALVLIGVGSFFWHAFPAEWSDYLDTGVIIVFGLLVSIGLAQKLFVRQIVRIVVIITTLGISLALEQLPYLNGSLPYLFLVLLGLVTSLAFMKINCRISARHLLIGMTIFSFAILARTIDIAVCEFISIGTHFLWHIFTAWAGIHLILSVTTNKNK